MKIILILAVFLAFCAISPGDEEKQNDKKEGMSKLLMLDYEGINAEGTRKARLRELHKIDLVKNISIDVQAWPSRVYVTDPSLEDGDNGFAWPMSKEQILGLVFARMDKKGKLTVSIGKSAKSEEEAIKAWFDSAGFKTTSFE